MPTHTVLLVEDNDMKARSIIRCLPTWIELNVVRVSTWAAARDVMATGDVGNPVKLVITDMNFPLGPDATEPSALGGQLVLDACRRWNIPAIVVSGTPKPDGYNDVWFSIENEFLAPFRDAVQDKLGLVATKAS